MPVTYFPPNCSGQQQLRRPYYPGHRSSYLELIPEEELEGFAKMDDKTDEPPARKPKSASQPEVDQLAPAKAHRLKPLPSDLTPMDDTSYATDYLSAGSTSYSGLNTPSSNDLSRSNSSTDLPTSNFESDSFPPVDRLTMFDILENFALPQRLERMQNAIHDNAEKLRRQRAKLASRALSGKNNIVGEWRKRVPQVQPEEQLDKYRRRMRDSVDRLSKRWNDAKTVTMKEKISFVTAVLNIFISAYLIGAWPEYFHYWYTAQLAYVSPTTHHHQLLTNNYSAATSCPSAGTTTTRSASTTSSPTSATSPTSSSPSASGSSPTPSASSSPASASLSATTPSPSRCGGTVSSSTVSTK